VANLVLNLIRDISRAVIRVLKRNLKKRNNFFRLGKSKKKEIIYLY